MPSSTPKLAIPYPIGTDLLADGDNAIQALAERVEALLSPTWTALPFGSGWSTLGGQQACEYTKIFGWLYFRGHANSSSTGANICTLPVGFRVAANQYFSVTYWNGSGLVTGQLALNTAGQLNTGWTPASGHNFGIALPPVWVGP
jgi:hypothetical protein